MKEYLIRVYDNNKKICGFKVEVENGMVRIPEGTLLTILNMIANRCGLRIEKEEFMVLETTW